MLREYNEKPHFSLAILFLGVGMFSASAAACKNPNLPKVSIALNETESVMHYCEGADWIAFPKIHAPGDWTSTPQDKIAASDGATENVFGYSVAVSDDVALIGTIVIASTMEI